MQQFKKLISHVLDNGTEKTDRTGTGTVSVFGYQTRFNMPCGFPLVTIKKTHMKSIVHELLWFLQGGTNIQPLVKSGVNIWNDWPYQRFKKYHEKHPIPPNYSNEDQTLLTQEQFVEKIKVDDIFAAQWGECGPIYGKQWVEWEKTDGTTINQIQNAIDTLRKTPDSRRIIVTAWRPDQVDNMALPPCHAFFQFITEPLTASEREDLYAETNNYTSQERAEMNPNAADLDVHFIMDELKVPKYRLSLQMYQRSCDLLLGVPFNIASYSLLLHMVAQCVNMVPHDFIHTFGDLHIYKNHLEAARELLTRKPLHLPTLKLNPLITDIFTFKYEDITIENYEAHPSIKLPVAV